jgi:uncharacterized protein YndB with AHSA1/START domain
MAIAQPMSDEPRVLHLSRRFSARPDQVFRALTRCAELSQWWGPKGFTVPDCTLDLRPGGAWRTVMRSPEGQDHIVSGVYREVEPPSRLAFTWGWEREDGRGHETLVTIELHERGGGTLLVLTQEAFESASARDQHSHGWASCFDCLEQALAEGAIA